MINNLRNYLQLLRNPDKLINQKVNEVTLDKLSKNNYQHIDQVEPNDIFIAGYPKSGNTWFQSLVAGILYGIDTSFLPDKLYQEIVPDVHTKTYYKRFGNINFFKTHHLPKPHYKKVIYLVRDGRDSIVSYFAMNKVWDLNITLKDMVVDGKGVFPDKWYKHVQAWQANPYNAEILFIKYEDLVNDTLHELERVCEFAGIERNIELLERVVVGSSISKMRSNATKFGMDHGNWQNGKAPQFFRKGKIGSYREEMSPDLQAYFNKEAKSELQIFNYI